MAGSVNKVIIIGNLGQDPEVRSFPSGGKVCNFSVATSENWKDRNTGERREKTEWHRVQAFGKLADIIGQYVGKGSKLYIEGKIHTRSWEQDGVKRYSTEITANEMQMLDSKRDSQPAAAPAVSAAAAEPADLPF